jgi:TRAP-type mannitol/chloroaromatic compound transport system substrate-binding protein
MTARSKITLAVAATGVALTAWSIPAVAATEIQALACFQRNHDYVAALHQHLIEPINKANGPVTIKYRGGPEVIPWKNQGSAIQRGLIDMIYCPGTYYSGILAEGRLPGAHNKSLAEIRSNGAWEMMQEAWDKGLNSRILSWTFQNGQRFYVYTLFKPKLSKTTGIDLTGVKMRSTGLYKAFMRKMGATPIVISPSDVYSALERGVVEGLAWPWGSVGTYGWEKFLKYRVEPSFFGATMLVLVNKKKFDSMTREEQAFLEKMARQYETSADESVIRLGKRDDEKLVKAGVKRLQLEGEYRAAYVRTIYGAKWAENDALADKFIVDYKTLKSKLYDPSK